MSKSGIVGRLCQRMRQVLAPGCMWATKTKLYCCAAPDVIWSATIELLQVATVFKRLHSLEFHHQELKYKRDFRARPTFVGHDNRA